MSVFAAGITGSDARAHLASFVLVFVSLLSAPPVTAGSLEDAQHFLASAQQSDGVIATPTDLAIARQSTGEALVSLGASNPVYQGGYDYLAVLSPDTSSTETLARVLLAGSLSNADPAGFRAELLARQNRDGGFGALPGFPSSDLDTAHALKALAAIEQTSSSATQQAIAYLLNGHANDRWGSTAGNAALALEIWHALFAYRHDQAEVMTVLDSVLAQWSNPFAEDFMEAQRLRAVLLRSRAAADHVDAIQAFMNRQHANGSWSDDVYSTALASQVLALAAQNYPNPDLASIRGRVIDAEYDTALADVIVTLGDGKQVTTAADGSFVFEGLDAGKVTLDIREDGYSELTADIQLNRGQDLDFGDLGLLSSTASGAVLRGTVHDAVHGAPLAGASVQLDGNSTITNTNGQFSFSGLDAGTRTLMLSASGYESSSSTVELVNGTVHVVSHTLQPVGAGSFTLFGTVTDAETGAALADTEIQVGGDANAATTTDSTGSYELTGLSTGYVTLSAGKSGYRTATGSAQASDGQTLNFSPALYPEGSTEEPSLHGALRGVVRDRASGLPVADASISLVSAEATVPGTSNPDGGFELEAPAGNYELEVSKPEYRDTSRNISLNESITLDIGEIEISPENYYPPISVSGSILDSTTSLPIVEAEVSINYGDQVDTALSGLNGLFAIDALGERNAVISIKVDGYDAVSWTMLLPDESLALGQVRLRPEGLAGFGPDLQITAVDVDDRQTDPSMLQVSGIVSATIRNRGMKTAPAGLDLLAFLDVDEDHVFDPAVDRPLGVSITSAGIEPETSLSLDVSVEGELPFRDAPIALSIDPSNALLEINEDNNFASTAFACRAQPEIGTLEPVEKFRWTGSDIMPAHDQVMSTPMVAPLFDTNGNGIIDDQDEPAIIFHTFADRDYQKNGVLRAISGVDGQELWTVTGAGLRTDPAGQLAIADIDGDGFVEVIAPTPSGLIAFEHDGSHKWTRSGLASGTWSSPAVADLNGDGSTEIVFGPYVLNSAGVVQWNGIYSGGVINSFGSYPMDITGDGLMEVIAGASVYTADGQRQWRNSSIGDGWTAVADFDQDGTPEIVHVTNGRIHLLSASGQKLWGPVSIPGGGHGGPPTIADMTGNGVPEIGVAGEANYMVLDAEGALLWVRPVFDQSGSTGSSVFDFDGDGKAEVVYADEVTLWIFDGRIGEILAAIPHSTGTTHEMPVVADVDMDGRAEIVVAANQFINTDGLKGIRVFESAEKNWIHTRSIWNQQAYTIDNINSDGTMPTSPEPNWRSHNTFRLNTIPGEDLLAAADLTLALFEIEDAGAGQPLVVTLRVGNAGERDARNFFVSLFAGAFEDGGERLARTTVPLLATGEFVDLSIELESLPETPSILHAVVNADDKVPECFTHNNSMTLPVIPTLGAISVTTDAPSYAPESDTLLTAVVNNTGTFTRGFEAQLLIEDSNGEVVHTFPRQDIGELASGGQRVVQEHWNTARYLAGTYRMRGNLYALGGELLASSTTEFIIGHDAAAGPLAGLRLVTDRAYYHTTDQVRFDLLAQNRSVSTLLDASSIRLTVTDPANTTVFDQDVSVRELAAGNSATLLRDQALNRAAIGEYTATAVWRAADDTVLAVAERDYDVVEDLSRALQGTVTVSSAELFIGDAQLCTEAVTNTGTQTANVQLRHTLARLDDAGANAGMPYTVSLAPDANDTQLLGIDTAGMAEGDYACVLEAEIDAAWQPLANATFRLLPPPIRIDAGMMTGERGRLLVLLDPACADRDPPETDGNTCDADPYGPSNGPVLPIQREHLEAVLEEAGWNATIVTSAEGFESEFTSRAYELYALFSEQVKLPEALQHDVVADIEAGRGLLVAGNHDRRNGRLEAALGIKSLGKNLDTDTLKLAPSEIHPGGDIGFVIAHAPNAIREEGAETLAEYVLEQKGNKTPDPEPAITRHAAGNGTGIYASFDWPMQSSAVGDDGELALLLDPTLTAAHPAPYTAIAGRVYPLRIELVNEGMATPGEIHLVLPDGAGLVESPQSHVIDGNNIRWPFVLAEDQILEFEAWIRLPETTGNADFNAVIYSGEGDDLTEQATTSLVIEIHPVE